MTDDRTDRAAELEAKLHASERTDLLVALAKARRAMQESPTPATISAYRSIRAQLELTAREAAPEAPALTWPNIAQVALHLRAEGWRITRKQMYVHQRQGKLRPRADGLFHGADVLHYATTHLKRRDAAHLPVEVADITKRKLEADTRLKEAQAELVELRTRLRLGGYYQREVVERGLAARAHTLRAGLLTWIRTQMPALVRLVGGDEARIPDAIQLLTAALQERLTEYTKPEGWADDAADL